jgi:hypothetical protein
VRAEPRRQRAAPAGDGARLDGARGALDDRGAVQRVADPFAIAEAVLREAEDPRGARRALVGPQPVGHDHLDQRSRGERAGERRLLRALLDDLHAVHPAVLERRRIERERQVEIIHVAALAHRPAVRRALARRPPQVGPRARGAVLEDSSSDSTWTSAASGAQPRASAFEPSRPSRTRRPMPGT